LQREGIAPDEGAFSLVPGLTPEKLRSEIRGREFLVAQSLLKGRRDQTEWTGAFLMSIHREIFGKHFPGDAGLPRRSEANFGSRAGQPPGQLDDLIRQLVLNISSHLETSLAISDTEEKMRSSFLSAARDHAEMVRIHPFVDGNGRWARIVTTAFLFDCGYPIGAIIRNAVRANYIRAVDRCIDEGAPGDLAKILLAGYVDAMQKANRYFK
jgi:fido (protein-threonine AMPylation protein)